VDFLCGNAIQKKARPRTRGVQYVLWFWAWVCAQLVRGTRSPESLVPDRAALEARASRPTLYQGMSKATLVETHSPSEAQATRTTAVTDESASVPVLLGCFIEHPLRSPVVSLP
jgi:hypothetical protein